MTTLRIRYPDTRLSTNKMTCPSTYIPERICTAKLQILYTGTVLTSKITDTVYRYGIDCLRQITIYQKTELELAVCSMLTKSLKIV
jgi:hypothetical protein